MQRTGIIERWGGNPLEMGPLYPFAGYEWLMFAVCVGLWILWTIWQMRFETTEYEQVTREGL
jgi:hypothetical protein